MPRDNLHTFLKSAQYGSFSKAAADLYISTPAVVKQINQLEDELGFKLFDRTHHGISLTKAGTNFYNDLIRIQKEYQDAVQRARLIQKGETLQIYMGVSSLAPGTSLIKQFNAINKADPSLHINIVDYRNDMSEAKDLLSHLGEGIDFVESFYDNNLLDYTGCQACKIKDMPICIGIPANHPLYDKTVLTYQDLKKQTILVPEKTLFQQMDETIQDMQDNHSDIHLKRFSAYEVSIFNQCVNENILLLGVEDWVNVHPLVKVVKVQWHHTIPFGILYSQKPSTAVKRFIKVLKHFNEGNVIKSF